MLVGAVALYFSVFQAFSPACVQIPSRRDNLVLIVVSTTLVLELKVTIAAVMENSIIITLYFLLPLELPVQW